MATQRICSIDGCCNKHAAKGYCITHYHRMKSHGKPDPIGVSVMKFLSELPNIETDECIIWPFKSIVNNYGYFTTRIHRKSKNIYVHRYVCEQRYGIPPSNKHETAHSCGNSLCINYRHLSWKTHQDNEKDKITHGTKLFGETTPAAKLTELEALCIKYSTGSTQKELAKQFGVTVKNIQMIKYGKTWKHLP